MQNITSKRGLVFSMHKVGSSTVMQAFREVGLNPERGYAENLDYLEAYGLENYPVIVTPVRDPIARNISWFFEQFGKDLTSNTNKRVLDTFVFSGYPLTWFDYWFKPAFGIDIYEHKFNKTRGWSVINDRFILVQTERMSKVLPDAFESVLGVRPVVEHRASSVETRPYGQLYKEFLETVKFPEEQVDSMYSSKFVKHFFTKKQVDAWRQRWTK